MPTIDDLTTPTLDDLTTPTIDDLSKHLLRYRPNSEAGALRMLENDFPDADPEVRAEAARLHRDKEGLGRVG